MLFMLCFVILKALQVSAIVLSGFNMSTLLSVIMLNVFEKIVVLLNVVVPLRVKLSVIMLSVVMLPVIMLSFFILSVTMLSNT